MATRFAWRHGSFPTWNTSAAAYVDVSVDVDAGGRAYYMNFWTRLGTWRESGCWSGNTYAYGYGDCRLDVDGVTRAWFSSDYNVSGYFCGGNYYWQGWDSNYTRVGPFWYDDNGNGRCIGFYMWDPIGFSVSGTMCPPPIGPAYSPPTGVSGQILTSNGKRGVGHSRISVGSWGRLSDKSWYVASRTNNRNPVNEWGSSSGSNEFYWANRMQSNVITTWYAEALNNHGYATFTGPYYIAPPSVPTCNAVGDGTTPSTTLSASITKRGGLENSRSADSAAISNWGLWLKRDDGSWPDDDHPNQQKNGDYKTVEFDILPSTTFELGHHYDVSICPTNVYGAWNNTVHLDGGERRLWAPTNVSMKSYDNSQPARLKITCDALRSGGFGGVSDESSRNNGAIYGYKIRYSDDESKLISGDYQETALQSGNEVTITGLSRDTVYYMQIIAVNTLGLSNISDIVQARTRNYFPPSGIELEFHAGDITIEAEGLSVDVDIAHPGGLTEDDSTVTLVELQVAPTSGGDFETVDSFTDSSTGSLTWHNHGLINAIGDYKGRVVATNALDVSTNTDFSVRAPKNSKVLHLQNYQTDYGLECPTQFQADTSTDDAGGIMFRGEYIRGTNLRWMFYCIDANTLLPPEFIASHYHFSTDNFYNKLPSSGGLEYDSSYLGYVEITNDFGVSSKRGPISLKTGKSSRWCIVSTRYPEGKSTTPLYKSWRSGSPREMLNNVFYIVKNSLGSKKIGDDLRNMRLKFASDGPIWVSQYTQAFIKLSNGKQIAYAYDQDNDTFVFGIFANTVWMPSLHTLLGIDLETTFFSERDGWSMDKYDFADIDNLEIEDIKFYNPNGLNASSPFGYTQCYQVPLWELGD